MKDKKLNVGCGRDIKKGFVNLDYVKAKNIDVVHDLEVFPYPFQDNTFDLITANQIIEHLNTPEKFVQELWRIAKPNARIEITTIHSSSTTAVWGDITHKRPYQHDTMNYFDIKYKHRDYGSLMNKRKEFFEVESIIGFKWFWKPLNYFVNINRWTKLIYERWFSNIFSADGQSFYLKVVKETSKDYACECLDCNYCHHCFLANKEKKLKKPTKRRLSRRKYEEEKRKPARRNAKKEKENNNYF